MKRSSENHFRLENIDSRSRRSKIKVILYNLSRLISTFLYLFSLKNSTEWFTSKFYIEVSVYTIYYAIGSTCRFNDLTSRVIPIK